MAMMNPNQSIERMADRIRDILGQKVHSIWLYGSIVLNDFRPGWSDIDLLVLSEDKITEDQAQQLVGLRQAMLKTEPDNPWYRSFEGVIAEVNEYVTGAFSRLVYWGTSGERITDHWQQDTFSLYELAEYGKSIYGRNDRGIFAKPSVMDLRNAVEQHYQAIRRYATQTDERLYSCGWLLDIARCVYTLRYNDVIAKTRAGEWALSAHLFENEEPMRTTLAIRENPSLYKNRDDVKQWLKELGPVVQQYADVLEKELYLADPCRASSLSFRKTKQVSVPKDIMIIREDQFDRGQYSGTDEPYFKLIHRLHEIKRPELSAQYKVIQCDIRNIARHISECYAEERLPLDEPGTCKQTPDFDPGLCLAVIDSKGKTVASGIADVDHDIGEGTLEWVQVSPECRRQGLGRYIVRELLQRLHEQVNFVTVSGKINNPDNPLALYRSCGFTDCVVWHIVRNQCGASKEQKRIPPSV